MDLRDTDRLATQTLELAGVPRSSIAPLARVARLLGIAVVLVPGLRVRGMLANVQGRPTIAIRKSLRGPEFSFTVGHELGHWALQRFGVKLDDPELEERTCNVFAACALMPRAQFGNQCLDASVPELAATFRATQASVAMRLGEVTGRPVAVVLPSRVYARGEWHAPDEDTLRIWSRRGRPGLVRTRFTDGAGVSLMGDEAV